MSHSGGKFLWLVAALHFHPHRVSLPLIWRTFSHLFRIFCPNVARRETGGSAMMMSHLRRVIRRNRSFRRTLRSSINRLDLLFQLNQPMVDQNALTLAGECKSDPIRTCKFVEKVSSAVTSGRLLATATSRSILD